MKKFLKFLVVATVIVAGILVLANVLLHTLLPAETAKKKLMSQLTSRLHREVQIGSVSVGIFSGLEVTDFKVSESPDFFQGTFITSSRFSLHVALWPLLFRKVIVKKLILHEPVVQVTRFADGRTFNFSDLTSPQVSTTTPAAASAPDTGSPQATPSAKPAEPPFTLLVSRAEISKGVLHFVDQSPAQQSIDIDPLNLKLHNVSLVSPFSLQLAMKAKTHGATLSVDTVGDLNLLTGTFKFKKCLLSSGKASASLSGRATNLRTANPQADFQLDLKDFNPALLGGLVPLPAGVRIEGPVSGSAKLKGDQTAMELAIYLDAARAAVRQDPTLSKPAQVPLSFSLKGQLENRSRLTIRSMGLTLGKAQITGQGRVDDVVGALPSVALHLNSRSLDVSDLRRYVKVPAPPELALGGSLDLSADLSGTTASSAINLKVDGKNLDASWPEMLRKAAGVALALKLNGEVLKPVGSETLTLNFSNLTLALGPLEWVGKGSVKSEKAVTQMRLAGQASSFSLAALAPLIPKLAVYNPTGNASLDLRVGGTTAAPMVNGSLALDRVGAKIERSELSQVAGTLRFAREDAATPQLTGKLNGSDFTIQLTAHHLQGSPDVNIDGKFAVLDLEKLLPPTTSAPAPKAVSWIPEAYAAEPANAKGAERPMKLVTHLAIGQLKHELYNGKDLDFKCNLANLTSDLATVTGTAVLKQGPGKLSNIEKLAAQSRAIKAALLPLLVLQKIDRQGELQKLGLPNLNNLPFQSIRGDYSFKSGSVNIQPFEILGNDLDLVAKGTVGLVGAQALDLKAQARLAVGAVGGTIGELVKDQNGRPTLKFSVTGPSSSPSVKVDLQEVGQRALQRLGDQLFKGLGGGASSSSGGATSAAPAGSANPDPAQDLQKALKNIFR